MAILLHLFTLQLLFGFFTLCILQKITADLRSVHPGGNISLNCNITADDEEIFWFLQRAEQMKALISGSRSKLDKIIKLSYNVTRSHFTVTQTSSSFSLVIIGVTETDLGLYYCGARKIEKPIQFRKTIRLSFTEENKQNVPGENIDIRHFSAPDYNRIIITLSCVCSVFILIIISLCVYYCRRQVKSVSPCNCWRNTTDSTEKENDLHYASVKYKSSPRAATERNSASDLDRVTYATVTSQHTNH